MDCPHETPGGAQRCALCRRTVLELHLPSKSYRSRWANGRTGVPMPDYVRAEWDRLRNNEPIEQPDLWTQGEL